MGAKEIENRRQPSLPAFPVNRCGGQTRSRLERLRFIDTYRTMLVAPPVELAYSLSVVRSLMAA
jgi:hypothetical protein